MPRKLSIKTFLGALAVCVSATMWGFDGIVLTPRLYNLPVEFVVFVLHLVPFLLMNILFFKEYRHLKKFSGMDAFWFTAIALTGGAVGTMAIVQALFLVNFQQLTVVVLLQKLQPVFALTLAAGLLKERLSRTFLLWASLAIAMGYFLTFGLNWPNFESGENTLYAAGYALLAAAAFGGSTVFSKKILLKYRFRTATFYRYGFTAVIMALVVTAGWKWSWFAAASEVNWLIIGVIGVTTGSGAIFLYYFGLSRVKAIIATICELCFPISAILFDYYFNETELTTVQWISAVIMLFAIVRISLSQNRKPSPAELESSTE